ncbi:MAG: prephenate dehydrogenase [Candidatus Methanoplasma sp.]|jgi:chorismate mutase/prephenate dehydrogenase|nr:prephenate dehydrogenase [Candidatus Methanoplasma sp.]
MNPAADPPANFGKNVKDIDRMILHLVAERTKAAASGDAGIDAEELRKAVEGTSLDRDTAEAVIDILKKTAAEMGPQCKPSESKRICVVGGRGKMGIWLGGLFASAGHSVTAVDKAPGCDHDISIAAECDIVAVATPISAISGILRELDGICGDQAIFDISSLKSPFIDVLTDMGSRRRVCSVHPMFGPGAKSMRGRNLIVCDCGNAEATGSVSELFGGRGANIVGMPVEDHDRYMSYVLGLSHAVNIAFFTVLERSGIPLEEFMSVASTTFKKNVDTNESVALEDPALYYEIQHLNSDSAKVWEEFSEAVKDVRAASLSDRSEEFTNLMARGRAFFTRG